MKVTVRAFGPIIELLGRKRIVDMPSGSTVDDLIHRLENDIKAKQEKSLGILGHNLTFLVNGMNVAVLRNQLLMEGDHVDVLSPFAGG